MQLNLMYEHPTIIAVHLPLITAKHVCKRDLSSPSTKINDAFLLGSSPFQQAKGEYQSASQRHGKPEFPLQGA